MAASSEDDQVIAEWVNRFVSVIKAAQGNKDEPAMCVVCGQPITRLKQISKSVYGLPCKHRQYQGRLSKVKYRVRLCKTEEKQED